MMKIALLLIVVQNCNYLVPFFKSLSFLSKKRNFTFRKGFSTPKSVRNSISKFVVQKAFQPKIRPSFWSTLKIQESTLLGFHNGYKLLMMNVQ
jgi:hypothetical protein